MRFSILIPAFKTSFLKFCIDSILAQSYKDFEIIVVDDASPYDIPYILSMYNDNRLQYHRNEVGFGAYNLVGNWNRCLEYAKGEYIICMGDDDMLEPNCLEDYNRVIINNPGISVVHGRTTIIDEHGVPIAKLSARDERETMWSNIWYRWNGRLQYIGDYAFNRIQLVNVGGFYNLPLAWSSDDITVNILARKNGIVNVNNYCFCYRSNNQTITNTSNPKDKMESIMLEEQWYREIVERERDVDDSFYPLVIDMFNNHFVKRKLSMITYDLSFNNRVCFWLRNAKKYGLSWKMIIYCYVNGLLGRGVNHYKRSIS